MYIPNFDDENIQLLSSQNAQKENIKININIANLSELETIPGVGEATAKAIIEYREKNGRFTLIEDIQNVSGIGESKFEKMKDYIKVK